MTKNRAWPWLKDWACRSFPILSKVWQHPLDRNELCVVAGCPGGGQPLAKPRLVWNLWPVAKLSSSIVFFGVSRHGCGQLQYAYWIPTDLNWDTWITRSEAGISLLVKSKAYVYQMLFVWSLHHFHDLFFDGRMPSIFYLEKVAHVLPPGVCRHPWDCDGAASGLCGLFFWGLDVFTVRGCALQM